MDDGPGLNYMQQLQEEPGRFAVFTILVRCILTVLFPRLGYSLRTTSCSCMSIPHFTMACITCFSHYLISTSSIPLFSPKAKCVISAFLPFSPTVVQKISSQSGQLDSQAVISLHCSTPRTVKIRLFTPSLCIYSIALAGRP